ncbi:MAG: hypothetical protein U1F76_00390 [Candidatus Competibacteraceae bacterium]
MTHPDTCDFPLETLEVYPEFEDEGFDSELGDEAWTEEIRRGRRRSPGRPGGRRLRPRLLRYPPRSPIRPRPQPTETARGGGVMPEPRSAIAVAGDSSGTLSLGAAAPEPASTGAAPQGGEHSRRAPGSVRRCAPPAELSPAERTALAVTTYFETGAPGRDSVFCRLQAQDIKRRMAMAAAAARRLGLSTIRGLTMMFDIRVGEGYGGNNFKLEAFAARIRSREAQLGRLLSEPEKLVEIADQSAVYAGRWEAQRRARRLVIAKGRHYYRHRDWNLDSRFPNLDDLAMI